MVRILKSEGYLADLNLVRDHEQRESQPLRLAFPSYTN